MMIEEFEIDWIPEEDSSSVIEDLAINIPAHTIDKMCKQKYGHTNWARIDLMSPNELLGNPHEFDYENGIIYFKNAYLV